MNLGNLKVIKLLAGKIYTFDRGYVGSSNRKMYMSL